MTRASRGVISAMMLAAMAAAGGCACSCSSDAGAMEGSAPVAAMKDQGAAAMTFRGVLHGGMMGIGGEHTGFELELADGSRLEIDPGSERAAARGLDGKRVMATGTVESRGYVERGNVRVLKADTIRAAEPAGDSK